MRRVWGAAVLVLLLTGDLAAGSSRDPRLAQLPVRAVVTSWWVLLCHTLCEGTATSAMCWGWHIAGS